MAMEWSRSARAAHCALVFCIAGFATTAASAREDNCTVVVAPTPALTAASSARIGVANSLFQNKTPPNCNTGDDGDTDDSDSPGNGDGNGGGNEQEALTNAASVSQIANTTAAIGAGVTQDIISAALGGDMTPEAGGLSPLAAGSPGLSA